MDHLERGRPVRHSFGANSHGQLGRGESAYHSTRSHSQELDNYRSKQGNGRDYYSLLPVEGVNPELAPDRGCDSRKWKSLLAAHPLASFGIDQDGYLWSWGYGWEGTLGHGTYRSCPVPTRVGDKKWKSVASNGKGVLGIQEDGSLWGWGYSKDGETGTGKISCTSTSLNISSGSGLQYFPFSRRGVVVARVRSGVSHAVVGSVKNLDSTEYEKYFAGSPRIANLSRTEYLSASYVSDYDPQGTLRVLASNARRDEFFSSEPTLQVVQVDQNAEDIGHDGLDAEVSCVFEGFVASDALGQLGLAPVVIAGGSGYTTAPKVEIVPQPKHKAEAEASVSDGVVESIEVLTSGSGYAAPPKVVISSPPEGGSQATAYAAIDADTGEVTAINILSQGSGYTHAPQVQLVGGGHGEGAEAIAKIADGEVRSIEVTSGGEGYRKAPEVVISGGGGAGAEAAVRILGRIRGFTIDSPGSGYESSSNVPVQETVSHSSRVRPFHQMSRTGGGGDYDSPFERTFDRYWFRAVLIKATPANDEILWDEPRYVGMCGLLPAPIESIEAVPDPDDEGESYVRISLLYRQGFEYESSVWLEDYELGNGHGASVEATLPQPSPDWDKPNLEYKRNISFSLSSQGEGYTFSPDIIIGPANEPQFIDPGPWKEVAISGVSVGLKEDGSLWQWGGGVCRPEPLKLNDNPQYRTTEVQDISQLFSPNTEIPNTPYIYRWKSGECSTLPEYPAFQGIPFVPAGYEVIEDAEPIGPKSGRRVYAHGDFRYIIDTDGVLWKQSSKLVTALIAGPEIEFLTAKAETTYSVFQNTAPGSVPHPWLPTYCDIPPGGVPPRTTTWTIQEVIPSEYDLALRIRGGTNDKVAVAHITMDVTGFTDGHEITSEETSWTGNCTPTFPGAIPFQIKMINNTLTYQNYKETGVSQQSFQLTGWGPEFLADEHVTPFGIGPGEEYPWNYTEKSIYPAYTAQAYLGTISSIEFSDKDGNPLESDPEYDTYKTSRYYRPGSVPVVQCGGRWKDYCPELDCGISESGELKYRPKFFGIDDEFFAGEPLPEMHASVLPEFDSIIKGGFCHAGGVIWKLPQWMSKPPLMIEPFSFAVDEPQSGFTSPPRLLTSQPSKTAQATATFSGGLYAVDPVNGGSGYTTPPTVTVDGGGGSDASVTAVIEGPLDSVTVMDGGSGYSSPPRVVFSDPGIPAKAVAQITGGISSVEVLSGGSGYDDSTTVSISGDGQGATATVQVSDGKITGVSITNSGSGYTQTPVVVFSGSGAGAQGRAVLNGSVSSVSLQNGGRYRTPPFFSFEPVASVTSITIESNGASFRTAPTVSLIGGGGSGARATPVFEGSLSGATIVVENGGVGYKSRPAVTVVSESGSGAQAVATINSQGAVTAVTFTAYGDGYLSPPSLAFSGGGGSGASAVVYSKLQSIAVVNGGSGYTSPPYVVVEGLGIGSGVFAKASVGTSGSGGSGYGTIDGSVIFFRITSEGSGYTSAPSVSVSAPDLGGGIRAVAEARIVGTVSAVEVTDGGSGYWHPSPEARVIDTGYPPLSSPLSNAGVPVGDMLHAGAGSRPDVFLVGGNCGTASTDWVPELIAPVAANGWPLPSYYLKDAASRDIDPVDDDSIAFGSISEVNPNKIGDAISYTSYEKDVFDLPIQSAYFYERPDVAFSDTVLVLPVMSASVSHIAIGKDFTSGSNSERMKDLHSLVLPVWIGGSGGRELEQTADFVVGMIVARFPVTKNFFLLANGLFAGHKFVEPPTIKIVDSVGEGLECELTLTEDGFVKESNYGFPEVTVKSESTENYSSLAGFTISGGVRLIETPAATCVLNGSGGVQSVSMQNKGGGFSRPPKVLFVGGGGVGARAECVVADEYPGDHSKRTLVVDSVIVTSAGGGYQSAPLVVFVPDEPNFPETWSMSAEEFEKAFVYGGDHGVATSATWPSGRWRPLGQVRHASNRFAGDFARETAGMELERFIPLPYAHNGPPSHSLPFQYRDDRVWARVSSDSFWSIYSRPTNWSDLRGFVGAFGINAASQLAESENSVPNSGSPRSAVVRTSSFPYVVSFGWYYRDNGSASLAPHLVSGKPSLVPFISSCVVDSVSCNRYSFGGYSRGEPGYIPSASHVRESAGVKQIHLSSPGAAYQSPPEVTFTGGGGEGCSARAVLGDDGSIAAVIVDNPGRGYATPPTVVFSTPEDPPENFAPAEATAELQGSLQITVSWNNWSDVFSSAGAFADPNSMWDHLSRSEGPVLYFNTLPAPLDGHALMCDEQDKAED